MRLNSLQCIPIINHLHHVDIKGWHRILRCQPDVLKDMLQSDGRLT